MKRVELAHDSTNLLEMYGHILRKVKGCAEKYDCDDLRKVYEIIKRHREKAVYILDKAYNALEE